MRRLHCTLTQAGVPHYLLTSMLRMLHLSTTTQHTHLQPKQLQLTHWLHVLLRQRLKSRPHHLASTPSILTLIEHMKCKSTAFGHSNASTMLICSGCDCGFHMKCFSIWCKPAKADDWKCFSCPAYTHVHTHVYLHVYSHVLTHAYTHV